MVTVFGVKVPSNAFGVIELLNSREVIEVLEEFPDIPLLIPATKNPGEIIPDTPGIVVEKTLATTEELDTPDIPTVTVGVDIPAELEPELAVKVLALEKSGETTETTEVEEDTPLNPPPGKASKGVADIAEKPNIEYLP